MADKRCVVTKEQALEKLRQNGNKIVERKYKDNKIMSREEKEIRENFNKIIKKIKKF